MTFIIIVGVCPLAGNSIHMDRTFIRKYMPKLESHLSYRLIDVSTLKELFKYVLYIIFILIYFICQGFYARRLE